MSPHRMRLAVPLIASGFALACGAAKTQDQTTSLPRAGHGQLALSLVDKPASGDVSEIWVKVTAVNVHHSGRGWVPVFPMAPPAPQSLVVDLLKLQDSALDLGLVDLPPGTITQVRLVIDPDADPDPTPPNYNTVVLSDGSEVPLKVPSGAQSGIKIHGPWEIAECNRTTLTLDFDGHGSIWYHPTGHGDLWILRPVIRVKSEEVQAVGCEPEVPPAEPVPCDPAAPAACAEGEVCLPSADASLPDPYYCAQHPGDESGCSAGVQCISGACEPDTSRCGYSDPGQPCYADSDCQSNACDLGSHTCEQGGGGAPCGAPGDCASGQCDAATSACADACAVATLPPGASCATNEECQSLVCGDDGKCGLNHAYDPCRPGEEDCDAGEGLFCSAVEGACIGQCEVTYSQPG